jgi:hypothetical protein
MKRKALILSVVLLLAISLLVPSALAASDADAELAALHCHPRPVYQDVHPGHVWSRCR